jgi:dienelactone hydrolase
MYRPTLFFRHSSVALLAVFFHTACGGPTDPSGFSTPAPGSTSYGPVLPLRRGETTAFDSTLVPKLDPPTTSTPTPVPGPTPLPAEVVGHWYLNRAGARITLSLANDSANGAPSGTSAAEDLAGAPAAIEHVAYDPSSGTLQFGVTELDGPAWYKVTCFDGVLTGRFAPGQAAAPTDPTTYTGRVTGWRHETFSADIVPRVWDVTLDGHHQAILRIDRPAPSSDRFIGTLKPYTTDGQLDEQPSEDIDVQAWDGQTLTFVRRASAAQEVFAGTTSGRMLAGTVTGAAGSTTPWGGARAEVLSHGLGARPADVVADWQRRTRARLGMLAFGGNPAPLSLQVTELGTGGPIPVRAVDLDRDDQMSDWPQNYVLHELSFDSTLPNPTGGAPLTRHAHGYMAIPTTPPPPGGYGIALGINGHTGSGHEDFDPQNYYFWFGDSFARRGFIVVAVDISHRPYEDRASVYSDEGYGDDPASGNGTHPAIKAPGMTSDWEEDGERTWDVMRGLDYALTLPDVNPRKVVAAGLSMGGEITDWVAAMDTRIEAAFAAGNPSDLAVMALHGNHPCWTWQGGNAREYYDPGDLHALVASRVLVRQTGKLDYCYSSASKPFATAKEVIRRAQPAFDALGGRLIHYLHYDDHTFHVGQLCPVLDINPGITTPTKQGPDPANPWATDWASDSETVKVAPSIYELIPGA